MVPLPLSKFSFSCDCASPRPVFQDPLLVTRESLGEVKTTSTTKKGIGDKGQKEQTVGRGFYHPLPLDTEAHGREE